MVKDERVSPVQFGPPSRFGCRPFQADLLEPHGLRLAKSIDIVRLDNIDKCTLRWHSAAPVGKASVVHDVL
jgi:hypothetical protein